MTKKRVEMGDGGSIYINSTLRRFCLSKSGQAGRRRKGFPWMKSQLSKYIYCPNCLSLLSFPFSKFIYFGSRNETKLLNELNSLAPK